MALAVAPTENESQKLKPQEPGPESVSNIRQPPGQAATYFAYVGVAVAWIHCSVNIYFPGAKRKAGWPKQGRNKAETSGSY